MKKISHKISFSNSLKRIVKTSLIVLIGILLSKILAYVYRVIIARNFGPGIYGTFSLAIMLISFVGCIATLGIDSGLLRFIPYYLGKSQNERIRYIYRVSLKYMFAAGVFAGVLTFLLSSLISLNIFHEPSMIIFVKWFSVFLPITLITSIYWSIIKAYERIDLYSFIVYIFYNAAQLGLLLIFLFLNLKSQSIIFSYTFGYLLVLIFSYWVSRKTFPEVFKTSTLSNKEKKETKKELFSYSWPMIFFGVIFTLYSWIDSLIIGFFMNAEAVGIYNAAVPIASLLSIVPLLFIHLLFPLITKEYSRNNPRMIEGLTKQVGKWIFMLDLPILVIMILFPGAIINILFGQEYMPAESSLRFLSIGVFFYSLFVISENLLSMAGKSKITLLNITIASIFNFVLNIILVPKYGIEGAAFSTMVSYLLWGLLSLYQAKKYTSIFPFKKDIIKIFFAIIIPAIVLFFTRQIIPINLFTMFLQGILFILLYLVILLLSKSLDKNDLMILEAIKNKLALK
jgi:O-antigen/teichoic acid export membrane protein